GTVAVIGAATNARGGDWMEDGRIVLLPVIGGGSALHQVPVTGGRLSPFIESDPSASQRWPQVLPGGGAVLYTRVQPGVPSAVVVQPLPAGERRTLLTGDYGRYVPSGHLLHVQDGALFATPFDASALELKGATTRIADGIAVTAAENAQIHASASGALVYQAGAATEVGAPLDWLSASGEVTALSAEAVDWVAPKFSPDGRHLAYNVPGGGLWTYDLARGVRSPVTATTRGAGVSAAWTPDGSRLVFSAAEADQPPNLYWRRSDGSGPVQRLGESPYQQSQPTWHPNGRVLAFQQATPPANDIMILEVEGSEAAGWKPGQASQFTDGPSIDIDPAFSADGRWLAFSSNESGRYEVHVRPFPGPGGRVVVSTGGGRYPQWSRTTNQLVFVERNDVPARLMVVNYRAENGAFVPDAPRPWANARIMPRRSNLNYTLHPDGTRVVTHVERPSDQVAGGGDRLVYVTNFSAELRRLAPPTR
ncbi:MAG: TolB family protein, partial [Vicinamibacterales bacterium]